MLKYKDIFCLSQVLANLKVLKSCNLGCIVTERFAIEPCNCAVSLEYVKNLPFYLISMIS